jgi:aryl-alcohol dehydrogenase-like predicted oxidoreductase
MRYQTFGRRTGLRVSELVLGTANFGSAKTSAGPEGARQIFEAFVAAGGTTFDSSSIYQRGEAETLLGIFLGRGRDDYVVITKYGGTREPDAKPGTTGNSRKTMVRSLEASLKRLGTDYVDVFLPHFPDGVTPMDEIVAGLEDLIAAGKIRHGGLSNFPAWRVAGGAAKSDALVAIQTEYSLAERSGDRELLPMAEAHGLGVLLYSPLKGGLLTGKYRTGGEGRLTGTQATPQQEAVVDAVVAVATETGSTPGRVALAWLRAKAATSPTALVPIVGPRTTDHLTDYLATLDLDLDPEHVAHLDSVSAPELGTPHEDVQRALSGGLDGDRATLRAPVVPVI